MTTDKIQFTKEKETMLITLNGRAVQSAWKNPILRDPWAEEAMRHIDYDMSKTLKGVSSWSMWKDIGCTIIATRAATFDMLTKRYLAIALIEKDRTVESVSHAQSITRHILGSK